MTSNGKRKRIRGNKENPYKSNDALSKIRPEHIKRLEQFGADKKFYDNVLNLRPHGYLETEVNFKELITDAFPWDETPEGSDFWRKVANGSPAFKNK